MITPHWTDAWDNAIAPTINKGPILLACDFDGTLAPIAPTPAEARLPKNTQLLLKKLSKCKDLILAFISGRELTNLKSLVGIDEAIYCGNHGMQIEGAGFAWESSDANTHRPELAAAINLIRCETTRMSGVIIEDKGLTASIHWRLASEQDRDSLRPLVANVAEAHPGLRLTHGKAVWELRPKIDKNKGTALKYLIDLAKLPHSRALYFGDDHTDEIAFQAIPYGITVRVGGSGDTSALFRARDVDDVVKMLFCILAVRNGGSFDVAPKSLKTAIRSITHNANRLFH